MADTPEPPDTPTQRHTREYEDPHFHDDDEVATVEDGEARGPHFPARKKKFPRRSRRYEED
jgi:hypothetical protein